MPFGYVPVVMTDLHARLPNLEVLDLDGVRPGRTTRARGSLDTFGPSTMIMVGVPYLIEHQLATRSFRSRF